MKKWFLTILLIVCVMPAVFASGMSIQELEDTATKILDFFTSTPVQLAFAIALCGFGVGAIVNRNNQDLKNKLIGWAIGMGLVLGASGITDIFFTSGTII